MARWCYLSTLKTSSWKVEEQVQTKPTCEGKTTEIIMKQTASLRKIIENSQTQLAPSRRTFETLPSKKHKYVPVKEEPHSSKEVMAIIGLVLERPKHVETPEDICLDDARPEGTLKIGSSLAPELLEILINLLKEFQDAFAYSVEEMSGIDPEIVVCLLNVDPNMKPICQKKRYLGPARNQLVDKEV